MKAVLEEIIKGNASFEGILNAVKISKDELEMLLIDMENSLLIRKTKDNKYRRINFAMGRVFKENKKLYVLVDEVKYEIDKNSLDKVEENCFVSIDCNTHNKTCSVINVLNKKVDIATGEVVTINNNNYIIEGKRYVLVEGYEEGQVISYEKEKVDGFYHAININLIGYKDDQYIIEKAAAARHGITIPFPSDALEELKHIKEQVDEDDIVGRTDLRKLPTFTIDCNGSKDFDDALSIVKLSNGNYKVYVHIAHVAHYIKKNSALDIEAKKRATSFYTAKYVIPQFPKEISNGICSLNPNVDRLTKTHEFEIDKDGNLISYKRYDSVINSDRRMNYDDVNKMFNGKDLYEEYKNELNDLRYVYLKLRGNRKKEQYIELNLDEFEEQYDGDNMSGIIARDRQDAEKLVEEFMLLAGKSNAHSTQDDLIYRTHSTPSKSKMARLVKSIEKAEDTNLNYKEPSVSEVSSLLQKLNKFKNAKIYNQLVLMRMASAKFSPVKDIHYALNFDYTCQVTSPIRRYTDLVNQRIDDGVFYSANELKQIAAYSSLQEKRSKEFETDVLRINMARFIDSEENKIYKGVILGTKENMISIQFYKGVVGLMCTSGKLTSIDELTFKNKDAIYRVGQEIDIEVTECDTTNGIVKVKKI